MDVLRNLKPGDPIEVWWADASEKDLYLRAAEPPLPNEYVETRQREIGWFIGVQKGEVWGDLHLLFEIRATDPSSAASRRKISSIPVTLIRELTALEVKTERTKR